jgi:hypothetical protein
MSYDRKKLSEYLSEILTNTTDDRNTFDPESPHAVLGGAGTVIRIGNSFVGRTADEGPPTLYVLEAGLRAQKGFADECLKDAEFAIRVGAEPIVKQLQAVICNLWPPAETLDLDDVTKREVLQPIRAKIKKWAVRVPIANLQIGKPLSVGNVTFIRHQDGIVSNATMVVAFPDTEGIDRVSEKAAMLKVVSDIAQQGSAWAETTVMAHEGRVTEVARSQIELSISAIRAFTHRFHSHSMRAAFGLPYELVGGFTGFIGTSETGVSIQSERRGFTAPFAVTDQVIEHLRQHFAFDALSQIVGAEWNELNTMHRAVRVALLWLSRSVIAQTLSEALTHCTIAIERLLIVDGEETTVERFADRLAYLISEDKEERKAIHKTAKRLYDVRSKIVHAGFTAADAEQRQEIEQLAFGAMAAVGKLINDVPTHEKLRDLLHDRKMQ